jgi:ribonuclease P protein subunit RPR2
MLGNIFLRTVFSIILMRRKLFKEIAIEVVEDLLSRAERIIKMYEDINLARRYVELALDVSTRCRVKLSCVSPYIVCKGCKTIMVPGRTCTVRMRSKRFKHLVITCLICKRKIRKPIF